MEALRIARAPLAAAAAALAVLATAGSAALAAPASPEAPARSSATPASAAAAGRAAREPAWPRLSPGSEPGHDELLSETDQIVEQVAKLRHLSVLHPVARGVLGRDAIAERIRKKMEEEYTPAELDAEARVYKRLGMLAPGVDYEKLLLDLLAEQVAGFYDPETKALYVADWIPMDTQRPALAHEIGHALVDQHFDLQRFEKPPAGDQDDDGDRQLAEQALVEGDGTCVMMDFLLAPLGMDTSSISGASGVAGAFTDMDRLLAMASKTEPVFDRAPAFLQKELLFPYLTGLSFVVALRKGASWDAVDAVYAHPPVSTAQLLHPEKYLAGELPAEIAAPATPLLPGAKPLKRDVLGEFGFRLFLETFAPPAAAEAAANGWDGDRLVAFSVSGGPPPAASRDVVVDRSSWETGADAGEAFAALRAALGRLAGAAAPCADEAVCTYADATGAGYAVERRDRQVVFTVGAPVASEPVLRAAVWKQLTVAAGRPGRPAPQRPAATPPRPDSPARRGSRKARRRRRRAPAAAR